MTYHLLLVRPRYEALASKTAEALAASHKSYTSGYSPSLDAPTEASNFAQNLYITKSNYAYKDPFIPPEFNLLHEEVDSALWQAQLLAYANSLDPRDTWNNSIVDICYPTKPDPRNPNNRLALITGYVFIRFADPKNPLPQSLLSRSTASIRYLTVFSHTVPDPSSYNPHTEKYTKTMDVYKPYTMDDVAVKALPDTLQENQHTILCNLIGQKVKIPCGLCMGMTGKIKKVTHDTRKPTNDPIVLVKIVSDTLFNGTYLSFTLSELT